MVMAAAMCLTVGGVYAAWTYGENANVTNATQHLTVNLTTAQDATTKGGISLSGGMTLDIDQADAQYHAKWGNNTQGTVTVTFTPTDISVTQIELQYTVAMNFDTYDHDNNPETAEIEVFKFINNAVTTTSFGVHQLTGSACSHDIAVNAVTGLIEFNQDFVLTSKAEHARFNTWLTQQANADKGISIVVSEVTA